MFPSHLKIVTLQDALEAFKSRGTMHEMLMTWGVVMCHVDLGNGTQDMLAAIRTACLAKLQTEFGIDTATLEARPLIDKDVTSRFYHDHGDRECQEYEGLAVGRGLLQVPGMNAAINVDF